jgi:uridine kinase
VESVLGQYMSTVRPAHYAHTFPAKFKADLVIADEGLPAYGHVAPTDRAVARMLAPVLNRLEKLGVV